MEGIKEYVLGVIAAASLCAIVSQLSGKDSFLGAVIKLITGVFMLLALASPIMNIRFKPNNTFSNLTLQADEITSTAAASTRESVALIIKEQTRSYILDKANSYGVDLDIEVTLSDDEIPVPVSVCVSGDVSPYTKKLLCESIEKDLGIGTESQIWN